MNWFIPALVRRRPVSGGAVAYSRAITRQSPIQGSSGSSSPGLPARWSRWRVRARRLGSKPTSKCERTVSLGPQPAKRALNARSLRRSEAIRAGGSAWPWRPEPTWSKPCLRAARRSRPSRSRSRCRPTNSLRSPSSWTRASDRTSDAQTPWVCASDRPSRTGSAEADLADPRTPCPVALDLLVHEPGATEDTSCHADGAPAGGLRIEGDVRIVTPPRHVRCTVSARETVGGRAGEQHRLSPDGPGCIRRLPTGEPHLWEHARRRVHRCPCEEDLVVRVRGDRHVEIARGAAREEVALLADGIRR